MCFIVNLELPVVVQIQQQMQQYPKQRYEYAKINTNVLLELENAEYKLVTLALLSIKYKSTLCGECCNTNSQHLVQYDTSDIYWYAMVKGNSPNTMCITPEIAYPLLQSARVSVPHYAIVKASELQNTIVKFTATPNDVSLGTNEGVVLYKILGLNVVALEKVKSQPYTFIRAVREHINLPLSKIISKVANNYINATEKQLEWLNKFYNWYSVNKKPHVKGNIDLGFLASVQKFNALENSEEYLKPVEFEWFPMIIVLSSPCPGCGKTRLGNVLQTIFECNNISCKRLSQDECGGNKKKFLQNILEIAKNHQVTIIDRMNHYKHLRDYKSIVANSMYNISLECDDLEQLKTVALQRICIRSGAHYSLYPTTTGLEKIVTSFISEWKPLTDVEKAEYFGTNYIPVNALDNIEDQCKELQQVWPWLKITEYVDKGLQYHYEYEDKLRASKTLKFIAVKLDTAAVLDLFEKHKAALETEFIQQYQTSFQANFPKLKNEFHITLWHSSSSSNYENAKKLVGQLRNFIVTDLVCDTNAVAFKGLLNDTEDWMASINFHITLAFKQAVGAHYCNTLVDYNSIHTNSNVIWHSCDDFEQLEGTVLEYF